MTESKADILVLDDAVDDDELDPQTVAEDIQLGAAVSIDQLKRCAPAVLQTLSKLHLNVNTEEHSLDTIGELTPKLRQLQLTDSLVNSFRDLGRALSTLEVLVMPRCSLADLDGIENLSALRELYLSGNSISDLSPLSSSSLPRLSLLDLRRNKISEPEAVEFLAFLPKLAKLALAGNPIAARVHYRAIVGCRLPSLASLDGRTISAEEKIALDSSQEEAIDAVKAKQLQREAENDGEPDSDQPLTDSADLESNSANSAIPTLPKQPQYDLKSLLLKPIAKASVLNALHDRDNSSSPAASGNDSDRESSIGLLSRSSASSAASTASTSSTASQSSSSSTAAALASFDVSSLSLGPRFSSLSSLATASISPSLNALDAKHSSNFGINSGSASKIARPQTAFARSSAAPARPSTAKSIHHVQGTLAADALNSPSHSKRLQAHLLTGSAWNSSQQQQQQQSHQLQQQQFAAARSNSNSPLLPADPFASSKHLQLSSASNSAQRPSTARPADKNAPRITKEELLRGSGSDLTYGSGDALCGSFVAALRARRKKGGETSRASSRAVSARASPELSASASTSAGAGAAGAAASTNALNSANASQPSSSRASATPSPSVQTSLANAEGKAESADDQSGSNSPRLPPPPITLQHEYDYAEPIRRNKRSQKQQQQQQQPAQSTPQLVQQSQAAAASGKASVEPVAQTQTLEAKSRLSPLPQPASLAISPSPSASASAAVSTANGPLSPSPASSSSAAASLRMRILSKQRPSSGPSAIGLSTSLHGAAAAAGLTMPRAVSDEFTATSPIPSPHAKPSVARTPHAQLSALAAAASSAGGQPSQQLSMLPPPAQPPVRRSSGISHAPASAAAAAAGNSSTSSNVRVRSAGTVSPARAQVAAAAGVAVSASPGTSSALASVQPRVRHGGVSASLSARTANKL